MSCHFLSIEQPVPKNTSILPCITYYSSRFLLALHVEDHFAERVEMKIRHLLAQPWRDPDISVGLMTNQPMRKKLGPIFELGRSLVYFFAWHATLNLRDKKRAASLRIYDRPTLNNFVMSPIFSGIVNHGLMFEKNITGAKNYRNIGMILIKV